MIQLGFFIVLFLYVGNEVGGPHPSRPYTKLVSFNSFISSELGLCNMIFKPIDVLYYSLYSFGWGMNIYRYPSVFLVITSTTRLVTRKHDYNIKREM